MVKSGDGEIITSQLVFLNSNVCEELAFTRVKLIATVLESGLKLLLSKFKCASFKSPQTATVSTLYEQTSAQS